MVRIALGSALMFTVFGCGGAKTYQFALNLKEGQSGNYQLNIEPAAGQGSKTQLTMNMTAEKVDSGQTTISTKISNLSINGQPSPMAALLSGITIHQVRDKQNKLVSTHVDGLPAGTPTNSANNLPMAVFSDKPVKVGDTWTAQADDGSQTSYKLAAVDNSGGKDIAEIDVTPASGKVDSEKIFVAVATGMPTSLQVNGVASPQGKINITAKAS